MPEKQADRGRSFEKALARLEQIVAEMEGGKLSLEKMVAYFEEGTELVKYCTEKLNEVERKIEILAKKGDELVTEPFEAEDETTGGKTG
ncbi:MAG: exodeoxyribonuclease VII small subunit [Verrucomicrobiota bacterium]